MQLNKATYVSGDTVISTFSSFEFISYQLLYGLESVLAVHVATSLALKSVCFYILNSPVAHCNTEVNYISHGVDPAAGTVVAHMGILVRSYTGYVAMVPANDNAIPARPYHTPGYAKLMLLAILAPRSHLAIVLIESYIICSLVGKSTQQ